MCPSAGVEYKPGWTAGGGTEKELLGSSPEATAHHHTSHFFRAEGKRQPFSWSKG